MWLRRLLTAVAVVSALSAAGLAVAAWWNRGAVRLVGFSRASDGQDVRLCVVTPTRFELVAIDLPGEPKPDPTFRIWHVGRSAVYVVYDCHWLAEPPTSSIVDATYSVTTTTFWGGRVGRAAIPVWGNLRLAWAPTWAVLAVVAAPAASVFGSRAVRRRRFGPGRCRRCGYDLRATPGRCPECGATPA